MLLVIVTIPIQAQTVSTVESKEETVELTPFQVVAEQSNGYATTRSLSGTKTNELLAELPNPISVLNREFLDDIKMESYLDAAKFAVGAQVLAATNDAGIASGDNALNFRGFTTNWQSRDSFQWYVPSDGYNIDRAEFNRGSAALLYGDSGPGGIMNLVTKRAEFNNRAGVLIRTDGNGSLRTELDVNRQLGDKVAMRLNLLSTVKKSWQDIAQNKQIGGALALAWEPGPRLANISLRLSTEWGKVENKFSHGLLANQYSLYSTGPDAVNQVGTPLPTGTALMRAAGANQRWTFLDGSLRNLESTAAYQFLESAVPTSNPDYDNVSEVQFDKHLNWRGPDYYDTRDFHTVTVELEKRFSPNFWMMLSYNLQDQYREVVGAGSYRNVRRDPNRFLPTAGGEVVANPHYGQLYIEHNVTKSSRKNVVQNYRWTALYDLNTSFMKQRFIAAVAYRDEIFFRRERREALRPDAITRLSPGASTQEGNNLIFHRYYISEGSGDNIRFALSPDTYWAQNLVRIPIQTLSSASATAFGHYWKNRIHTNFGFRRDIWYRLFNSNARDPVTNQELEVKNANGDYVRGATTAEDDLTVDSSNIGAVVDFGKWASLAANRSNSFVFNSLGEYFNGEYPGEAISGVSKDLTLRLTPFGDKVGANITYFETTSPAALTGIAASTLVETEVLNLLPRLSIPSFNRNGNDTYAEKATGYEIEIIANPTKALTLRFGYSKWDRDRTNIFPRYTALVEEMKKIATTPAEYVETEQSMNNRKATLLANARDRHWNLAARYSFREGKWKGAYVGANARYTTGPVYVLSGHPNRTPGSYATINGFVGYTGKVGEKYKYDIRVSIDNLTDKTIQLGGYGDRFYLDPRLISISLGVKL